MIKYLVRRITEKYGAPESPDVRQKFGAITGFTGICLNLLLFAGKLIAGIISASISTTADALNNLSDAGSSIITLIGFKMSAMPADSEHPFGHGRIEYIAGLTVSFVIMLMGFELGKSSVEKIISPETITFSWITLTILVVSILVKLFMYYYNHKIGTIINSAPMKATAMDSFSDMLATGAVIAGLVFFLITGINIDGYIGILVALFILYTGFNTAKDSLSPLLGEVPDPQMVQSVADTVMSYQEIVGVHDLMIHNYGVGVSVISLHAEVPMEMDFVAAHELIDVIEADLKIKYKCYATIHMDPVAVNDEETNKVKDKVTRLIKAIDSSLTIHDFRMTNGQFHMNLIFDVVVPFKFRLSDNELTASIQDAISALDDKYFAVINVDRMLSGNINTFTS